MRKRWLEELKKESASEIRRELEKQGKHTTATEILLTMLRKLARLRLLLPGAGILELRQSKIRDIVSNEKLRSGIDGVIDQELVAILSRKPKWKLPRSSSN